MLSGELTLIIRHLYRALVQVPYPVMLFLAFTACNSQTWYETAGLVTSTRNFETERCAGYHCLGRNGKTVSLLVAPIPTAQGHERAPVLISLQCMRARSPGLFSG